MEDVALLYTHDSGIFLYENPCQEEEEEKKSANKKEVTFVMEFMVRMKSADMENTCYITRDYIDYASLNRDLYLKEKTDAEARS